VNIEVRRLQFKLIDHPQIGVSFELGADLKRTLVEAARKDHALFRETLEMVEVSILRLIQSGTLKKGGFAKVEGNSTAPTISIKNEDLTTDALKALVIN